MATIVIKLDPLQLTNPDIDIRYRLPDLLVERSEGRLIDDGFNYDGEGGEASMLLFLRAIDAEAALPNLLAVLQEERVCDNDLSALPVAVEDGDNFRVVHPSGYLGDFPRPRRS